MKKVLILGSSGMLGHMVYLSLNRTKRYLVTDCSYPDRFSQNGVILDVRDKAMTTAFILDQKPDIVINCIGILIKGSNSNPADAIYINSFFPHQLAGLMRNTGGRLIHISTDCVFSGEKGNYLEDDYKDARDIYGLSKALGEVINVNDLTLRTSIIGPELKADGEGLFHWFSKQKGKVTGYTNAFWSGVTTLELAAAIDAAIEQNLTGLFNLTNGKKISKHDLLKLIMKTWNRGDIELEPCSSKFVDKSLITSRSDFDYSIKSYEQMLFDLFMFMKSERVLYNRYFE